MGAEADRASRDVLLVDEAPVLVVRLDVDLRVLEVSGGLARLIGASGAGVVGEEWVERVVPERERAFVRDELAVAVRGGGERAFSHGLMAPDGSSRLFEWRARRGSDARGGAPSIVMAGVVVAAPRQREAVTEASDAAAELAREREMRAAVASSERLALIVHDLDSVVRSVEGRAFLARGIDTSKILGARMLDLYAGVPGFPEAFARARTGERTALSSRTERTAFEATYVPLFGADGVQDGVVSVVVDVTPNAEAERELKRARDLLRSVIDSTPDWIFAKDRAHRILVANEAFARSQDLSPDAMIGRVDSEIWPLELCEGDAATGRRGFHDDDRDAFEGQLIRNEHDLATLADGTQRVFDTYKGPLRDARGEVYGVLAYSRDVTDERAAAEALRKALAERETLLREIHHRVKNNLQMVASLVHFHEKGATSREATEAFAELSRRLVAMSLVHEKLYQSRDLARVDLGEYLRALVHAVEGSFAAGPRVQVEVAGSTVIAPIETALPAGMIVCELVTNVRKHAYPRGATGPARVTIEATAHGALVAVADDGVGLAEGIDPLAARTFGWTLVRSLAEQLRGRLTVRRGPGTQVVVAFPVAPPGAEPASGPTGDRAAARREP